MKNLKKLFASVASLAILASMFPVVTLGAASYSDELQEAYDYAYNLGITTMSSIDGANMYGTLTRAHMAKMIVNRAKEVKNLEADTDKTCEFNDIASQSQEMKDYIEEACQMGLMGVGITAFNPNGAVTRAQFGTVLSRVLRGDENEGGDPYYMNHLEALQDADIMNNIATPMANEIRGYVMLMMMRADDAGTTPEICETPENQTACSLGLDTCPSECTDDDEEPTVKAGSLAVELESSLGGDTPASVPALEVATYTIEAGDEDVDLESLTFEQGGSSDDDTIAAIALAIDGQRVSKFVKIDDEATINLTSAYEIKAGDSVEVAVIAELPDVATAPDGIDGDKFNLTLTELESSAEDVDYDNDLTSATYTVLNKNNVEIEIASNSSEDVNLGEEGVQLFEIKLDNSTDKDAIVKAITFKGADSDYADYFENFELQANGETVAEVEMMNGKYLTFNLEDDYVLQDGDTETFAVVADVVGGSSEANIAFIIEKASDLVVIGTKYNVPASIVDDTSAIADNYAIDTFVVKAGDISLTKTNPGSDTIVSNRDNISLGAFTIKNNAGGDLTLQDFDLEFNEANIDNYLDAVKIRVGSTSASLKELDHVNNSNTYSYDDLGKEIGSSLTIYVYADTQDVDVSTLNFKMTLKNVVIEDADEEVVANDDISPSTLTFSTMNGGDSTLTVTKTTLTTKSVAKGSEDLDAVSFKVKTSTTEGAEITKLTFSGVANPATGTVNTNTINSASVFVGNTEYSATVKSNGTIVLDKDFTLNANTTTAIVLKVSLQDEPTITSFVYSLIEIEGNDTSSDENDLTSEQNLAGRSFTVVDGADLVLDYEATSTNNKYAKSILAGTTATVAEYSVYANYEAVTVGSAVLVFDTTNMDTSVTDVKLFYDGEEVASDPTWDANADTATFDDLDFDIATSEEKLEVRLVTTTINSDGGDTKELIQITSLTLADLEGATSGDELDDPSVDNTETQKEFDIVPVTVFTSVTDVTATTAKLNLNVTKGNNTDATASNLAAKATVTELFMSIAGNNGGLDDVYVKDDSNNIIRDWTDTDTDGTIDAGEFALADQILSAGTTTWTVYVVHDGIIDNPSYTLSLDGVEYSANAEPATIVSDRAGVVKTIISK